MTTTSTSNAISTGEQIYIAFTNTPTAGLALGGENTSHNCYGDALEQCAKLWQDQGGKATWEAVYHPKDSTSKINKANVINTTKKGE